MNEAVLDTSVLSCFARTGRLELLEQVLRPFSVVVTAEVLGEIQQGLMIYPELRPALDLPWIRVVRLSEPGDLELFTRYYGRLDLGEATVLAYAKRREIVAFIDEKAGRLLAREEHIVHHGSLWVIAGAIRGGFLTMEQGSELVDGLRGAGTYLPCNGAGFPAWAHQHGLFGVVEPPTVGLRPPVRP